MNTKKLALWVLTVVGAVTVTLILTGRGIGGWSQTMLGELTANDEWKEGYYFDRVDFSASKTGTLDVKLSSDNFRVEAQLFTKKGMSIRTVEGRDPVRGLSMGRSMVMFQQKLPAGEYELLVLNADGNMGKGTYTVELEFVPEGVEWRDRVWRRVGKAIGL